MALRASAQATLSVTAITHIQYDNQSAATTAGAASSVRRPGISRTCRVSHSLHTSRKPAISAVHRTSSIRMEGAPVATTSEAGSLDKEEGPLLSDTVDVSEHVAVLKRAAKTKKVPPTEVFAAIRAIEKAKVNPSNFLQYLGGTQSPGRTWMLVFTAGKNLVRDALQGGPGGGKYLPVTAVQNFDAAALRIENGVYLGPLGALAFEGRFSMNKRILAFLFDKVKIKIGSLPHFSINIGKKEDEGRTPGNTDPFFIWFYADDEIIVAKGRGGGLAFWCRCKRVSENF
ncbi:uncharacterized protein [Physcomitrium patens]|uniref:Plastid lipid-associated protein/fibrillin conserved domain-containing protein n=1 Tax=Physcomitrium patens TaxID=3218 RepID=A0A2K1K8B0_PHYPA|nr:uncharacterized protein LOC112285615 [Physcomitrium patens]PNR50009.1 hypothetical protein PHYPA_011906 [Physcomitrium patens]|eukprot:XP_024382336.1 uncharacterized protein LOC112285615 [Physcomitrella patens]